jgi:hypothetical protein
MVCRVPSNERAYEGCANPASLHAKYRIGSQLEPRGKDPLNRYDGQG